MNILVLFNTKKFTTEIRTLNTDEQKVLFFGFFFNLWIVF